MTCHTPFAAPSASAQPEAMSEPVMSPEEQCFWERMTFRQFTVIFLRLQAVWLLFDAVVAVTYLPPYFRGLTDSAGPDFRLGFLMALLRIILHVAAALAIVRYSERVVSWFAKDWTTKQPSSNEPL